MGRVNIICEPCGKVLLHDPLHVNSVKMCLGNLHDTFLHCSGLRVQIQIPKFRIDPFPSKPIQFQYFSDRKNTVNRM